MKDSSNGFNGDLCETSCAHCEAPNEANEIEENNDNDFGANPFLWTVFVTMYRAILLFFYNICVAPFAYRGLEVPTENNHDDQTDNAAREEGRDEEEIDDPMPPLEYVEEATADQTDNTIIRPNGYSLILPINLPVKLPVNDQGENQADAHVAEREIEESDRASIDDEDNKIEDIDADNLSSSYSPMPPLEYVEEEDPADQTDNAIREEIADDNRSNLDGRSSPWVVPQKQGIFDGRDHLEENVNEQREPSNSNGVPDPNIPSLLQVSALSNSSDGSYGTFTGATPFNTTSHGSNNPQVGDTPANTPVAERRESPLTPNHSSNTSQVDEIPDHTSVADGEERGEQNESPGSVWSLRVSLLSVASEASEANASTPLLENNLLGAIPSLSATLESGPYHLT